MELMRVIEKRRSVRAYKPQPVEKEKIEKIIHAAVMAPTAMNAQPWAFGVIQDQSILDTINARTKAFLLKKQEEWPWLSRFAESCKDPGFSVFYGATALVTIYAKEDAPLARIDCSLAAENLMLAATDLGLATCWMGRVGFFLGTPEANKEFDIPAGYVPVAPIAVGYPATEPSVPARNPTEMLYWKRAAAR
jgi:nitroreductase